MIGAGEYHAPDASQSRRFEYIVGAGDIGIEHDLPRAFLGHAAQVHHAVDAAHGGGHRGEIVEIGPDAFLAGPGRSQRPDIGQPQQWIGAAQRLAQRIADETGGAGDENMLHGSCPRRIAAQRIV
jgi:hypothetical protein